MSKYNTNAQQESQANQAGGKAYQLDDKTALYISASTSLGGGAGDKFYTSANAEYTGIVELVNKVAKRDPAFVFQLAAYARRELNLRSIPTILFIEGIRAMANNKKKGAAYPVDVTQFATTVFGRPDEITEAIAYWLHINQGNHKLPMPLRRSLELALNKFNEYSMIKYNSSSKSVKLKDVIRLVHPTPKGENQAALFNYLIRGVADSSTVVPEGHRQPLSQENFKRLLPQTYARDLLLKLDKFDQQAKDLIIESNATWETVTSKFGSTPEVWNHVLPNMGYMATLRNLNNFLKHELDLTPIIAKLENKEEVLKSKQMPFRFLSAMKAISTTEATRYSYFSGGPNVFASWKSGTDKKDLLKKALGQALNHSVSNIPKFSGRTLVAADVSGSMEHAMNEKSTVTMKEIACVMAAMAQYISEDGIAAAFGTTFAVTKATDNILDTAQNIAELVRIVNMSTNAWTILQYLLDNKIVCDRVMYFTDTQCYNSYGDGKTLNQLWAKYKDFVYDATGKMPYLYEVNLAGGNTSNFDRNSGVAQIGGWSEKIFELMSTFETDPRATVDKISEMFPVSQSITLE